MTTRVFLFITFYCLFMGISTTAYFRGHTIPPLFAMIMLTILALIVIKIGKDE